MQHQVEQQLAHLRRRQLGGRHLDTIAHHLQGAERPHLDVHPGPGVGLGLRCPGRRRRARWGGRQDVTHGHGRIDGRRRVVDDLRLRGQPERAVEVERRPGLPVPGELGA
jgi:hypothetical protein